MPQAGSVVIGCIALYFAMLWGFDAARILTSPIYGLDHHAFARAIYAIANQLGLGPNGMLVLAASAGAAEAAIACIFICHVVDRAGQLAGHEPDHETLEAAVIAGATALVFAAVPALVEGHSALLRQHALHFILAGIVVILSFSERHWLRAQAPRAPLKAVPPQIFDNGISLPLTRQGVTAGRWDHLRRAAAATA